MYKCHGCLVKFQLNLKTNNDIDLNLIQLESIIPSDLFKKKRDQRPTIMSHQVIYIFPFCMNEL